MAPRPSSPLRRSVTKRTAFSIARRRRFAGKNGSIFRMSPSRIVKTRDIGEAVGGVIQSRTDSGGSTNNSRTVMPRGLRARGRSAISTRTGTRKTRDQYEILFR